MNNRTNSIVWCTTYYFVVALIAACQPFMFDRSAEYLSRIAVALPLSYWLIYDARMRRIFVPHIIQPAIASFWILVVPLYMLSTRKWWGLVYLIFHVICTLAVSMIGYYATIYFVWPTIFPDGGG